MYCYFFIQTTPRSSFHSFIHSILALCHIAFQSFDYSRVPNGLAAVAGAGGGTGSGTGVGNSYDSASSAGSASLKGPGRGLQKR